MKKILFLACPFIISATCSRDIQSNLPELTDGNHTTYYSGTTGKNRMLFYYPSNDPVLTYKIYSSDNNPNSDPFSWTLKGSNDGCKWVIIDTRKAQSFCARYQEKLFEVKNPGNYHQYLLEAETFKNDSLRIGDFILCNNNQLKEWDNFSYPDIDFNIMAPDTEGHRLYNMLVQDPSEYIRYHAQKVAEILFYNDNDTMNNVQKIEYILKNYDGISAKSGQPPVVSIVYSTQHIEKSAKESMFKLDYETRGVLYHELVHAYQFEPKGIGSYSTNKEFWAYIEGLADAVRAQAGFFDIKALRKPGGHWLDGYQTTGFFLKWLTTKDPDAIRKIHLTVRDLPEWSFDKSMKQVFGPDNSIESMWNEYQNYLTEMSK